jgi:Tol biopolymer transport system component
LSFRQPPQNLPVACRDGHYLVYASRTGITADLWRADIDGGNPLQLTKTGDVGTAPSAVACSPDSKWVAFAANDPHSRGGAWRVPIDGGAVTKLGSDVDRPRVSISPDGKMVALHEWGQTPNSPSLLVAAPAEGGQPLSSFPAPAAMTALQWSPDSKNLQYVLTREGVGNLWEQPLSGGPAHQLTHFKSDLILDYSWSFDGKQLAMARGNFNSNVVLISNFQ